MSTGVGTTVHLRGSGVFIFRPTGALNTGANSAILSWKIALAPANIDDAGITMVAGVTLKGRALATGQTVTTDTDAITVPSGANDCSAPTPVPVMMGLGQFIFAFYSSTCSTSGSITG